MDFIDATGRDCPDCGEWKSEASYAKGSKKCFECRKAWRIAYEAKLDPEQKKLSQKKRNIWKKYRLRLPEYEELTKDGCEICGVKENLHIDHDHDCCPGEVTCGKCIRGVLCSNHNRGEGYFKSIEEITGLLAYRLKFEKDFIHD